MRKVCGVIWCSLADPDTTRMWLEPAHAWARPLMVAYQPMPLPALQSLFDGLYTPGLQWYWEADFVDALPEEAIAKHLKFGS